MTSPGSRATKSRKSKGAKAPKAADPRWVSEPRLLWLRLGWSALAACWIFALLSMVGFHPYDAPAAGVFPHNAPPANWCGRFGAVFAYYGFEMFGYGLWVLIGLSALLLWFVATGRKVGHTVVRVIGGLMIVAAIASLQALLFPTSGPIRPIGGGLLGSSATHQLIERFNQVGTFFILMVALFVGAIVALDMWAILAAMWAGKWMLAGAKQSAKLGGALAGQLADMRKNTAKRSPVEIRLNDLDDADVPGRQTGSGSGGPGGPGGPGKGGRRKKDTSVEPDGAAAIAVLGAATDDDEATSDAADLKGKPTRPAAKEPDAAAAPTLGDRSASSLTAEGDTDADDEAVAASDAEFDAMLNATSDEDDQDGSEQDDAAASATKLPQTFDPEALRAKMAKMPVRFANKDRVPATDADLRDIQNSSDLEGYRFPGLDLLEEPEGNYSSTMEAYVREQAENLERALKEYRIDGGVVGVESGPVITLYEVKLAPGTKVAVLTALSSDLARSLKAVNIRIVSNTAGRDTVGIEVPNTLKEKVRLKELMTKFEKGGKMRLPMFLGKDASGAPLIEDLCAMPHLLIAGTTGSGKSVCMNSILMSFLYTKKPNELKLVLVDPKMVELSQFKDIPHLMCPVVTEMGKATAILEWAVRKMDERYELLAEAGVRDIAAYNEMPWEELKERFEPTSPEEEAKIPRKLPYMVFVIDELADLMMTNKEVEGSIVRIAQKARAVGIHLILATQRPQANVVTGLIKSNMPGRIAFKVASGMDSRIVLDQKGGELLLGQGDMLYLSPRSHKLTRAQGTLVDDKEIRRVAKFMKEVAAPTFERQLIQIRPGSTGAEEETRDGFVNAQEDPMFDQAVEIVLETKRGSVSMLQRRLAIGYTRAARLIEMMGEAGILGGHKGTVAREVVLTLEEWQAMKEQWAADAAANEGSGSPPASPGATTPGTSTGPVPSSGQPGAAGTKPAVQSDLFRDPELMKITAASRPIIAEPDAFDDSFSEDDGWEQGGEPKPKKKKEEESDEDDGAPF